MRRVPYWAVTFLALEALFAAWSLSQPLFAAPDEPAHVVKAAAVARGQLTGTPNHSVADLPLTTVDVPAIFGSSNAIPRCYMQRPAVPASCAPALHGPATTDDVDTYAGLYPPLFYFLTGLPTLVLKSTFGVYVMRLVAGTLSAVMITGAAVACHGARGSRLLIAGVAAALTPMAVFLAGMVNPSGLEIAAAICFWAAALAVTTWWSGRIPVHLVVWAGASAVVLAVTRTSGPLWLATIVLAVAIARGAPPVTRLVRDQVAVRLALAFTALAVAASVGWLLYVGDLGLTGRPVRGTTADIAAESLGRTRPRIRDSVGRFGWLDTAAPTPTYALWFGLGTALVVAGMAVARRRVLVALALVAAVVVFVPVGFETAQGRDVGLYWQGRYSMPVMAGLPLLAAFAVAGLTSLRSTTVRRAATIGAVAFVVAHVLALLQAMRRFMVGRVGPLDFLVDAQWTPPVPAPTLAVVALAASIVIAWQFRRLAVESVGDYSA